LPTSLHTATDLRMDIVVMTALNQVHCHLDQILNGSNVWSDDVTKLLIVEAAKRLFFWQLENHQM